jgi:hypothetical protein
VEAARKSAEETDRGKGEHLDGDRQTQILLSSSRDGCYTQSRERHAAVQNIELLSCGTQCGKA